MKKTVLLALVCGVLMLCVIGCGVKPQAPVDQGANNSTEVMTTEPETEASTFGLGSTIEFDGLEITLGDSYSFTTLNNQFSDYNGESVIQIPVHIKNISEEIHGLNIFYCKFYGSQGVQLHDVESYFDNTVLDMGQIRPGAEGDAIFYLLYDGDGTYYIDFDNFSETAEFEFDVTQG